MLDQRPVLAVAIPVRDEEAHIGACLGALDGQIDGPIDHIVLLINNSSDATVVKAKAFQPRPGNKAFMSLSAAFLWTRPMPATPGDWPWRWPQALLVRAAS